MAITSKEHKTGSFFIKNNFEGESWVKSVLIIMNKAQHIFCAIFCVFYS